MSAKPRVLKDSRLNFRVKPNSPGAARLAAVRALLIARQMRANPEGVPLLKAPKAAAIKTRGRPRSVDTTKSLAQYEFDAEHLEALRQLGYGNVPPNKTALVALAKRLFPNDPRPTAARLSSLKKALQRERARRRR